VETGGGAFATARGLSCTTSSILKHERMLLRKRPYCHIAEKGRVNYEVDKTLNTMVRPHKKKGLSFQTAPYFMKLINDFTKTA
jgi:hypothetical protein